MILVTLSLQIAFKSPANKFTGAPHFTLSNLEVV